MTEEPQPDNVPQPHPLLSGGKFRYSRDSLEFGRLANFSDAVFAIALTLLAVELHPPMLPHEGDATALLHGLGDMSDELIIFFVAFAFMGSYWQANHRFVSTLRGVDSSYVAWTLPFLAVVAFLPFPSAVMAKYFENPVAVSFFAVNMAVVSLLEWVLLWRAHRGDLFVRRLTPAGYRWASIGALQPVLVFVVSIPVMWIGTTLGLLVWMLNIPAGLFLNKHIPEAELTQSSQ